jgi:(p)ppGpp synthase/HD superfamily hydrolase
MKAHAGQFRKADPHVPYVTHPIHVAFAVREAGGDEDTVIAALLHDLLEDTETTPEDLEAAFGTRVTGIVRELSEDKSLPWAERKRRMVEHLRTASEEACLVAGCDKTHNLETLVSAHRARGPDVWKSFRAGPESTIRFHAEAFEALRDRVPPSVRAAYQRALDAARRLVRCD